MNSRKITALLLSSAMALSVLTGCGGVNKDKTVATLNGEPVKLGVANFAARFGQAGADDFYTAYFGKNVWTSDLYGNGTTGQDNFKDSVMDSLEDMYVLQLHMDEYNVSITDDEKAAITAAAAQFMEDNSKDAINALGATQEIVEEYLTLETIQSKMKAAIVAGADTNVTDEEAKTGAYSYVGISKTTHQDESGNTVDYTDEEKEELAAKVADFAKAAKEDGLDAAAEDAGYDENYFKMLTAEHKVTRWKGGRKVERWELKDPAQKRNEAFDVRNYATAALEISNPQGLEVPGEETARPAKQQHQYRRRRSGGI